MQLKDAILFLFFQLENVLEAMSDDQYKSPIPSLSGATIGQHTRHVIECYQELLKGYQRGYVNYDQRKRDLRLETGKRLALRHMALIGDSLEQPDKRLILVGSFDRDIEIDLPSSYYRELMHNLDHTIHHMALIRIGVSAISTVPIPQSFGVAYSTIKFRAGAALSKQIK